MVFDKGAGARGLEIQGKLVKFTAIGVYLEDTAVPSLSVKWKGKSREELTESVEFFRDIVTGNGLNRFHSPICCGFRQGFPLFCPL
jgi:chalcone isomerase